jgi:hypothetical protein
MRLAAVTVAVLALGAVACSSDPSAANAGATTPDVALAASVDEGGSVGAGLTVSGSGEASGMPDVVRVTVGVEVERSTVQEALNEANAATDQVLRTLDGAGIPEEDRQTREFSIYPVHEESPQGGGTQVRGYTVVNLVEATVRDIERVGEVLQAVADAGGDNIRIQDVRFDLEDDGEQLAAARRAAFEDARATAEQYAQLAGGDLGALIGIEDVTVTTPRSAELRQAADAAIAEMDVPIEPGEQQVVVRIVARWALN